MDKARVTEPIVLTPTIGVGAVLLKNVLLSDVWALVVKNDSSVTGVTRLGLTPLDPF